MRGFQMNDKMWEQIEPRGLTPSVKQVVKPVAAASFHWTASYCQTELTLNGIVHPELEFHPFTIHHFFFSGGSDDLILNHHHLDFTPKTVNVKCLYTAPVGVIQVSIKHSSPRWCYIFLVKTSTVASGELGKLVYMLLELARVNMNVAQLKSYGGYTADPFNRSRSKYAYNPIPCIYVSDPKSTCVHSNMSRLSLTALLQRAAEFVPERLPSLTDCAVSEGTNYFSLECKLFFPLCCGRH